MLLGWSVGGWVLLREKPGYIGAFGCVSPLLGADGVLSNILGLVSGLYVPLLYFN